MNTREDQPVTLRGDLPHQLTVLIPVNMGETADEMLASTRIVPITFTLCFRKQKMMVTSPPKNEKG